jgi:hypothetical protein
MHVRRLVVKEYGLSRIPFELDYPNVPGSTEERLSRLASLVLGSGGRA